MSGLSGRFAAEDLAHEDDQLQCALVSDPVIHPVGVLSGEQNAFVTQNGQVLGYVALGCADGLDNVLYTDLTFSDDTQDLEPERMGDGLEGAGGGFYLLGLADQINNGMTIHDQRSIRQR
jgi:hypothetical protein